jgi:hypothetical protein
MASFVVHELLAATSKWYGSLVQAGSGKDLHMPHGH